MKKLLVLFAAVAATMTASAATKTKTTVYFNRYQFQYAKATNDIVTEWQKAPTNYKVDTSYDYDLQLTVPLVYKGTLALKPTWAMEPGLDILEVAYPSLDTTVKKMVKRLSISDCLVTAKKSLPAYMTICQPCIDCYPCDVLDNDSSAVPHAGIIAKRAANAAFGAPGWITSWNLYVVVRADKSKGRDETKDVSIAKIDLLDDATPGAAAIYFTGATKKNVYVNQQLYGLSLTGAKNDYKFKYTPAFLTVATANMANPAYPGAGEDPYIADPAADPEYTWVVTGEKDATAYIASASALKGTIAFSAIDNYTNDTIADDAAGVSVLDVAGTLNLTRDASSTKKAIERALGSESTEETSAGWGDCHIVADAKSCEEYMSDFDGFETQFLGAGKENKDSFYKNYDDVAIYPTSVVSFENYFMDLNGVYNTEYDKASYLLLGGEYFSWLKKTLVY